jgi:hypothetical protein
MQSVVIAEDGVGDVTSARSTFFFCSAHFGSE